jgi:hypothetical protein
MVINQRLLPNTIRMVSQLAGREAMNIAWSKFPPLRLNAS